jgi:NAD(P)-dependent dehydrogenase (short-subunit alcohol dehydrogenase family)
MSIEGKVIIVTGGTSGIGEGCVRHFAQVGAEVVAASIQDDEGAALAAELDNVDFVYTDVSDEAQVEALVSQTRELHGRIDGCASNAGVWRKGKVTDLATGCWSSPLRWRRLWASRSTRCIARRRLRWTRWCVA